MVVATYCSLAVLGCSKTPPPGEAPAEGSAALGHGPGPRQVPSEAYTACDGKKAGDACTVKHGDQTLNGQCSSPPEGAADTRLNCRPERPEKKPD
jgi:hypothetical protein